MYTIEYKMSDDKEWARYAESKSYSGALEHAVHIAAFPTWRYKARILKNGFPVWEGGAL